MRPSPLPQGCRWRQSKGFEKAEYDALPLVGILASLAVDDSVLNYAERRGFFVMAVGDELMEIKNRPDFEPKRW